MSKPSYTYTTLTPQKLDTLIKLSTTGFKKGPIKIGKPCISLFVIVPFSGGLIRNKGPCISLALFIVYWA